MLDNLAVDEREKAAAEKRLQTRGDWLKGQCVDSPQMQYYHREEIRGRSQRVIDALTKARPPAKKASSLLRAHNATGRKFDYPKGIYVDPTAALYEGQHVEKEEEEEEEEAPTQTRRATSVRSSMASFDEAPG